MNLIWKIEEKTYQTKALLEVMQDGLCNDVVGINQDYYATVLRVVMDKVDEIQRAIEEDYRQRREEMQDEDDEYEDDETDGDGTPGPRKEFDSPAGDAVQDSEPEDSEAREEDAVGLYSGSFGVALVKEHEDGGATYEIHGSKAQMERLFSAFFIDALNRGIDEAEQSTSKWIDRNKIIKKAQELEEQLRKWEVTDDYDYLPEVQKTREELTELLKEHGAVR